MRKQLYKNIALLFSGNVVAYALAVASIPFLTRFFSPEDFGVYQLFVSLTGILSMLATGQYELGIIAPKYNYCAFTLAVATIMLSIMSSILFSVGSYFLVDYFSFLRSMYFSGISFWIGMYIFSTCLFQVCYHWLVRRAQYPKTVLASVINALGGVLFPILAFYLDVDYGLIKGVVIAKLISVLCLCNYLIGMSRIHKRCFNIKFFLRILRRYIVFIKYVLPGNTLNCLVSNVPSFLLNHFFGITVTGYYSMADRCIGLPISLASKSAGDVFKQEASVKYHQAGECISIYNKVMHLLLKISFCFSFLVIAFAPDIFSIVLGEQWRTSGEYARILVLLGATSLVYSPISMIYVLTLRVKAYMVLQLVSVWLIITTFVVSGLLFSAEITLFLYSLAKATVNIAGIIYGREIAKGEKN